VAGLSGHNTKIAVSKLEWGVKLPCESSKVGNGYTANGPVITYKLPPEEIERIFTKAKKPEGKPPIHWKNPYQKKEVEKDMATRLETARATLTKEQYLAAKEEGISDREFLKQSGLPEIWLDVMQILKKDWKLEGLALKKVPTSPKQEPVNQPDPETISPNPPENQPDPGMISPDPPENEPVPEPAIAAPADDDDEIVFYVTPSKQSQSSEAVLRVSPKGITFNMAAGRLLSGMLHFRVGITRSKKIALMPSESGKSTYRIGTDKSKSNGLKIGGGNLLAQLKQNGIELGYYRLVKNEDRGQFQTEGAAVPDAKMLRLQ